MYCGKCGEEIAEDSLFCSHCGSPVGEESSKQNEYTVTLYEIGKDKIKVIEAVQKWFSCSLQTAFDKVEYLPIVLSIEKDEETAKGIVKEWQRLGADVRIANEDDVAVLSPSKQNSKGKKSPKSTSKINSKTIIKMISSCLFVIATLLFFFLPIVFNKVSVNSQVIEKPYSLLNLVIIYVTNIVNGDYQLSFSIFTMYPLIILIFVLVMWVKMAISTIKGLIGDLKNVTKKRPINYANKIGFLTIIELVGYMIALFFIFGFDGIIVVNAIIIALSAIFGAILEKLAYK